MGLFRSKKTAKIEELTIKVSKLECELEEALSNNKLHKNNYSKQGEALLKLQEELKVKNSEIVDLSKTNIDLEVKLNTYITSLADKNVKLESLEAKLKDLPSILKELNNLKIVLLEKDAKINTLESELLKEKEKSNSKTIEASKSSLDTVIEEIDEDDYEEDYDDVGVVISSTPTEELSNSMDISNVEEDEDINIPNDAPIEYIGLSSRGTNLIPREVIINDTVISVTSWKGVYKEVVEYMRKNCQSFNIIVGTRIRIGKGLRTIVSKDKSEVTVGYNSKNGVGYTVCEPLDIGDSLYLEAPSLSASDVLSRLKTLCDFMGLSQSSIKLGVINLNTV